MAAKDPNDAATTTAAMNATTTSSNNTSSGSSTSGDASAAVDLTCPVCYDTFRSPRFLPCHHTLCTLCIGDLMERAGPQGRDFFLCPLCQGTVKVPEEGVTSFQVNFYLAPFLSGRVRADSGPRQPKDGQTQKRTPDSSPSTSFDLSCEEHWSGPWGTYCRVCACLVCRPSCAQHQGQDHTLVPVAAEAPGQRSEVRRQLLSLTTLQGSLADLEEECRHRVSALENSRRQVEEKVETTRHQACASLGACAARASEKVRGMKERISKVMEGEMKSIQEKRAALFSLLTSASDVLAAGDAEFLRQKTKLVARIQSVMSKVPPSRGQLQFSFKMSPAVQALVTQETRFGHMTVQFQSPVLRQRLTLSSTKQQRKLRKLCPRGDGSVLAAVGNCLVTISPDLTEAQRLEFPGEVVDFLPPSRDGFVYVVLPFPHAVKRLNVATDVAADFVSPLNPPTAMACTEKRELVLASHDSKELSLTFYSETGTRLRRVTLPRPEFTPVSMAVTKQGRLFLCSPAEVLCLDSDLSELDSLGDLQGLRPRGVSGLRGLGSGVGDVLMANAASGNVEILELCNDKLTRKEEIIQWKRGTTDEDADLSKGLIPKISCAMLDQSGKLWVGQEDGDVSVYDWLLRTS